MVNSKSIIGLALLALIFFPLALLLLHAGNLRLDLNGEVGEVVIVTTLQAALSAILSLVAGGLGGAGLLWLNGRIRPSAMRFIEGIVMLPNAAPVLLLILSVAKIFPWARGLGGIVFVHTLLNVGLVSLAISRLANLKLSGLSELAWIEGAGKSRFLFRIAIPVLRRDLGLLFLFVFAVCFASFAVPLALGGSRATTLEVLIYQKIRISGDWSAALGISVLQMILIFALAWVLGRKETDVNSPAERRVSPLLYFSWGLPLAIAPALLLVAGLTNGLGAGWRGLVGGLSGVSGSAQIQEMMRLIYVSILIGICTGVLVAVMLLALAFAQPNGWQKKVWIGFTSPSSALIGFALLVLFRPLGLASYFKIILGLSLIMLPMFFRFRWDSVLRSLQGQVRIASSLGAGDWLSFRRIVFPQVVQPACFIGGLAALWAWGDFALSSVIAERNITLAMQVRALLESYRFNEATVLALFVSLGGLLTFAIFVGAGYVLGTKSQA